MSGFFFVLGAALVLTLGVSGVVAAVTGRVVLPWPCDRVRRPGVWGAGASLLAVGLMAGRTVPVAVRLPLMLVGLVLILLGQILGPRRAGRDG
ncbi:hypothetical protein F0L17_16675 [Streptomyces sp. TRM43335]|uniref:Uncharacterized protein n=1 Tax=Streptomyces taklimakanensis TaxID=2569853 RepID=A0A6G2BEK6_9ACTN|nr:hypothetical protein [Streptomyces taklimakanensis]MTE20715.1 hypothetical protein [Streptomyces taklimakanensis]